MPAEGVWVVNDGRKEIDRLNHRQRFPAGLRQIVNAGIVGRVVANQNFFVRHPWHRLQCLIENLRAEL